MITRSEKGSALTYTEMDQNFLEGRNLKGKLAPEDDLGVDGDHYTLIENQVSIDGIDYVVNPEISGASYRFALDFDVLENIGSTNSSLNYFEVQTDVDILAISFVDNMAVYNTYFEIFDTIIELVAELYNGEYFEIPLINIFDAVDFHKNTLQPIEIKLSDNYDIVVHTDYIKILGVWEAYSNKDLIKDETGFNSLQQEVLAEARTYADAITGNELIEAPQDGKQYARLDATWNEVIIPEVIIPEVEYGATRKGSKYLDNLEYFDNDATSTNLTSSDYDIEFGGFIRDGKVHTIYSNGMYTTISIKIINSDNTTTTYASLTPPDNFGGIGRYAWSSKNGRYFFSTSGTSYGQGISGKVYDYNLNTQWTSSSFDVTARKRTVTFNEFFNEVYINDGTDSLKVYTLNSGTTGMVYKETVNPGIYSHSMLTEMENGLIHIDTHGAILDPANGFAVVSYGMRFSTDPRLIGYTSWRPMSGNGLVSNYIGIKSDRFIFLSVNPTDDGLFEPIGEEIVVTGAPSLSSTQGTILCDENYAYISNRWQKGINKISLTAMRGSYSVVRAMDNDYSTSETMSDGVFVIGKNNNISEPDSLLSGVGLINAKSSTVSLGSYNKGHDTSLLEVGNGTTSERSNAFEIYPSGQIIAPTSDKTEIVDPKSLVTKEFIDDGTYLNFNYGTF